MYKTNNLFLLSQNQYCKFMTNWLKLKVILTINWYFYYYFFKYQKYHYDLSVTFINTQICLFHFLSHHRNIYSYLFWWLGLNILLQNFLKWNLLLYFIYLLSWEEKKKSSKSSHRLNKFFSNIITKIDKEKL